MDVTSEASGDLRSNIAHRWLGSDLNLARAQKHAIVWFASEILDALDCPIITPSGWGLATGFASFLNGTEQQNRPRTTLNQPSSRSSTPREGKMKTSHLVQGPRTVRIHVAESR